MVCLGMKCFASELEFDFTELIFSLVSLLWVLFTIGAVGARASTIGFKQGLCLDIAVMNYVTSAIVTHHSTHITVNTVIGLC